MYKKVIIMTFTMPSLPPSTSNPCHKFVAIIRVRPHTVLHIVLLDIIYSVIGTYVDTCRGVCIWLVYRKRKCICKSTHNIQVCVIYTA